MINRKRTVQEMVFSGWIMHRKDVKSIQEIFEEVAGEGTKTIIKKKEESDQVMEQVETKKIGS